MYAMLPREFILIICLIVGVVVAIAVAAVLAWRRRQMQKRTKLLELLPMSPAESQVADIDTIEAPRVVPPDTAAGSPASGLDKPASGGPILGAPSSESTASPESAVQPLFKTSDRLWAPEAAPPASREKPPSEPTPETAVREPSTRSKDPSEQEMSAGTDQNKDQGECGNSETPPVDGEPSPPPPEPLHSAPPPAKPSPVSPRGPTQHTDRRGAKRATPAPATETKELDRTSVPALRQATVGLRLAIDPNRKSIRLSIVLSRPEGFPKRIEPEVAGTETVHAFDDDRYDDVDIEWTTDLLESELRFADSEQYLEWLRSARDFHLFSAVAGEPDLLSVSAAAARTEHAIICRESDIPDIRRTATATGSRPPKLIQGWGGIPVGWVVLTGYAPTRPFHSQVEPRLRPLGPDAGIKIHLIGGPPIRSNTYAEGCAPRIMIEPPPLGCEVRIGGRNATRQSDGSWTAPGADAPGGHLIDVVPGPSRTYTILPDPGAVEGWQVWDAHPGRASSVVSTDWARTEICGAQVFAETGSTVVAHESKWSVLALGARANVQPLIRRNDAPATVAILQFSPAFLVLSVGLRRHQGKVVWQGKDPSGTRPRMRRIPDQKWVSSVRTVAARHLAVCPDTTEARSAWRSAAVAARRVWRGKA